MQNEWWLCTQSSTCHTQTHSMSHFSTMTVKIDAMTEAHVDRAATDAVPPGAFVVLVILPPDPDGVVVPPDTVVPDGVVDDVEFDNLRSDAESAPDPPPTLLGLLALLTAGSDIPS